MYMYMIHKINGNLREICMSRENFLLQARTARACASIMVHISKKTKIGKYLA
jgi:hypothetical protein